MGVAWGAMQAIHIYEQVPLSTAGIVMGLLLVAGHLIALLYSQQVLYMMKAACNIPLPAQILTILDFVWISLLLWDAPWNALRMDLFDFEGLREVLLVLCPVMCYTLCVYSKQNLLGRALGLFLLLLGIIPLEAAFLKEPVTRILIPLWWYPVLTAAILWVALPYLLRDWVYALERHPRLFRVLASCGLSYGMVLLICAIFFF